MIVDLTLDEGQFLIDNLSQLSVPLGNPEAEKVAGVGRSCIEKLQGAMLRDAKKASTNGTGKKVPEKVGK